jgi:chemotaxis protein methyltransferase WspC
MPSFELPVFKPQDSAPPQAPSLPENLLDRARQLGDAGRYPEAEELCRQVLLKHADDTRALFLAAQLAEVQDDLVVSRSRLERILFLDPSSAGACLELAALARRESQPDRAQRLEQAARRILRDMKPEQLVAPYDIPARELLAQLGVS